MFKVPESLRNGGDFLKKDSPYWSDTSFGNNGVFYMRLREKAGRNQTRFYSLKIIASDGENWEHVSVSLPNRCPTWAEMCKVKERFWGPEDTVVQYHPPESEYVNHHPYCLHLWRPEHLVLPLPSSYMVGPKDDQ